MEEPTSFTEQEYATILKILRKQNMKETEEALKREAASAGFMKLSDSYTANDGVAPKQYHHGYESLCSFVDKSLEIYRIELAQVLYPVFVHMYLKLICSGWDTIAMQFFAEHGRKQDSIYEQDLARLCAVTKPEHIRGCDLAENFRKCKYVLHMCTESYQSLKNHLQTQQHTMILNIIQDHLSIEVFDGAPRSRQDLMSKAGSMCGEASNTANKAKVQYGVPRDPTLATALAQLEEEEYEMLPEDERPKKKKPKKDPTLHPGKKGKSLAVPNAPSLTRLALPKPREDQIQSKLKSLKEAARCPPLSNASSVSVCFYTVLNTSKSLCAVSISDDSSMLAGSFEDSSIHVWSLVPKKLSSMKPPTQLTVIPYSAEDIMERILDTSTCSETVILNGHTGAIYSTSFNPDKTLLLSSSEDGTVRLWSLQTFTAVVCFRGHNYPVWEVEFSPLGFYFASASRDNTARVWSTDHIHPLRILAGHTTDVECLKFHPNGNYLATGSGDCTVRLWDVLNGQCVRLFTGHKGSIQVLTFTPDGRYLASAGTDLTIRVWDLSLATHVCELHRHQGTIYSLVFSRDGTILASGGLDNCVVLWDASIFEEEQKRRNASSEGFLASFPTKSTPIQRLHFTRKNLLLAAGPYIT